jgi:hypothetical protein
MTEEKIQSYVLGELSAEESAEVAAAIGRDPKLQDRERRYRLIRDGFRQKRISGIQAELLAFDNTLSPLPSPAPAPAPTQAVGPEVGGAGKIEPKRKSWITRLQPKRRSRRKQLQPFLLVVAVLLGMLSLYWLQPSPTETLAQSYYIDPPEPDKPSTENVSQVYLEALDYFFIKKDYARARTSFTILIKEADFRSTARFYLPHTNFKLREYERANGQFAQALVDDNQPPLRRTLLRWNAMIIHLALGKDISLELANEWPANYPISALREALREQD